MLSNRDFDVFARIGRFVGIALFVIAFFVPGVHEGGNIEYGWACAAWTLWGTVVFIATLFKGEPDASMFYLFFRLSGWISPFAIVGIFIGSEKAKQVMAKIMPILLLMPWIVFAYPDDAIGAPKITASIGHYLWTAGCLLVFAPQYIKFFAPSLRSTTPPTSPLSPSS